MKKDLTEIVFILDRSGSFSCRSFSVGRKRGILNSTNRNLTKECDYMGKAILAAIVTLIVGYLGMVVGLELLGNWGEFGLLIAIAVMGAFIIYFNDKK